MNREREVGIEWESIEKIYHENKYKVKSKLEKVFIENLEK